MGQDYIAKAKIRVGDTVYQPGEVMDGSVIPDLDYLLKNKYLVPVPAAKKSRCEVPEENSRNLVDGCPEPDDDGDGVPELYTEGQLKKLGNKAAIVEYAESIGLPGLDVNRHKTELIDDVLAYIAEVDGDDV